MVTSIVILNYNDADTTIDLVNRIIDYKVIDHIIVVDNCSTDDSLIKLNIIRNSKVSILEADKNGGYGYGNNLGIRFAYEKIKSNYIIISNPDVEFSNKCVENIISFMKDNTEYVVCAPIQYLHKLNGKILEPWRITSLFKLVFGTSIIFSKIFRISSKYKNFNVFDSNVFDCDVVQGAMLILDAEFAYKFGQYDEDIFLYNEEECLAQKVIKEKRKSAVFKSEYYVHHHSVSISKTYKSIYKKRKLQINSRKIYIYKYYKLNFLKKIFVFLFLKYCIFESLVISILKK